MIGKKVAEMDFENLEELKKLRARGVLSEEQFERRYSRMAQRILNDRKEEARSKSGLVYLLLAYFTGTIEIGRASCRERV